MELVIVRLGFEVGDYVLPVGREDVLVGSVESLIDLCDPSSVCSSHDTTMAKKGELVHLPRLPCRIQRRARNLGLRATVTLASRYGIDYAQAFGGWMVDGRSIPSHWHLSQVIDRLANGF